MLSAPQAPSTDGRRSENTSLIEAPIVQPAWQNLDAKWSRAQRGFDIGMQNLGDLIAIDVA
jgi:hypothetical protein